MPVVIRMPDFGTAVDEVRVVKWFIEQGASVTRGQVLAEIETDKAVSELESVAQGVLLKQAVPEGASVKAGTVIAYVGQPGEVVPEQQPPATETASAPAGPAGGRTAALTARISPVVANLARKLGVDVGSVQGTGEFGTITREDVLRASKSPPPVAAGEPLPRAQAAVARAVFKSSQEIPHLRVAASLDMSAVEKIRNGISYDAIFVKAMARAAETVPLVTARLDGEQVVRPDAVHIALAVGFENQLYLPVVRDPGRKDLAAIDREIVALAARAKEGGLKIEDTAGGCMTLSNLGMYPIDWFEAVIFPGQSTILAVGAVQRRPVVIADRIEVRPVAAVTFAADHRLINGRTAAEFLTKLKAIVESGAFA